MNKVMYWNAILLEASRRDHSQGYANGQQSGPTATSRAMAIVHVAIHDAVAYMNKPDAAYLKKKHAVNMLKPAGADLNDVIDGAAVTSLKAMYPKYHDYFNDSLSQTQPIGFNFGVQIAQALIGQRINDGSVGPMPPTPPKAYGTHVADPYHTDQVMLGPHWGNVKHFVGPKKFLSDFPGYGLPSYLTNPDYKADYDEVRNLGAKASVNRIPEQTLIGVYWGYDGSQGIGVPPRLYNQIARKFARDSTVTEAAELFAQINVAMADAGIDAWYYKYKQNLWRPVAGIRNEVSVADRDLFWAPLGAPQTNRLGAKPLTPPFPSYPSGHATFGAAFFQILRLLNGPNAASITVADVLAAGANNATVQSETFNFVSDEFDGRAVDTDGSVRTHHDRVLASFARAIWENAISRVYLGVHWRFDGLPRNAANNVGGVPLGLAIGEQVHKYFKEPVSLNSAN